MRSGTQAVKEGFDFRVFCIMLCLCLGVSMPPGAHASLVGSDDAEENYVLEPGDRLEIKIFPDDDYIKGGETEISTEGNVTLPLVGKIPVAGLTVIDAERAIAQVLDQDYLVNPEVVIAVQQFKTRSFVVLGMVNRPGTYSFPQGATRVTLLQAVSIAGGFSEIANIKKIKIVRQSSGEVLRANAEDIIGGRTADIELQPNDVVHVSESMF